MYNDFYRMSVNTVHVMRAFCIVCVWWENHFEKMVITHVEVGEAFNAYLKLDFLVVGIHWPTVLIPNIVLGSEMISAAFWNWFFLSDCSEHFYCSLWSSACFHLKYEDGFLRIEKAMCIVLMCRLLTLKFQQGSESGWINGALQGHGEKACSFGFLGGDNFNIKDIIGHFKAGDSTICMIAFHLIQKKFHVDWNMVIIVEKFICNSQHCYIFTIDQKTKGDILDYFEYKTKLFCSQHI